MNKYFIPFFLSAALSLSACHQDKANTSVTDLTRYQGKPVLVNYWASWCKACLKEMPDLNTLYLHHHIMVIGVSFDPLTKKELKTAQKKIGVNYPLVAHFPLKKYHFPTSYVLPVTYVVNRHGQLATVLHGPQTEKAFLDALDQHR